MNEEILQNMSRALTHLVFRNGIVEKLHSEGRCLDNENQILTLPLYMAFLLDEM